MEIAASCAPDLLEVVLAVIAIFHSQRVFRSPDSMDRYLGGEVSPGAWRWVGSWSAEILPFKYRVVFRGLFDGLADLLSSIAGRALLVCWSALVSVTIGAIVFADVGIVIDSLRRGSGGRTAGERFEASFVPVAVLLLALHVFAARFAEIRLSFLLAPWVVLAAARWLGGVSDRGRWLRASLGAGAMLAVLGGGWRCRV